MVSQPTEYTRPGDASEEESGLHSGPLSSRIVDSAGDKETTSACRVLAPPLLACLHDFAHVPHGANLPSAAVSQGRMLRHELYGMIHVARLQECDAAELFLGFRKGTVGGCHFAVFPVQGQCGFGRLKRFA